MKVELKGIGVQITEDLRDYVQDKVSGLERRLSDEQGEIEVVVTFTAEEPGQRRRVDLNLYKIPGGGSLHAGEESDDIFKSLELVFDNINRQFRRLKQKRRERRKKAAREKEEALTEAREPVSPLERVVKEEIPIAKPITLEEALMILQDQDEFFLAFRNTDTGEVNVVYRKQSGNFGHIVP